MMTHMKSTRLLLLLCPLVLCSYIGSYSQQTHKQEKDALDVLNYQEDTLTKEGTSALYATLERFTSGDISDNEAMRIHSLRFANTSRLTEVFPSLKLFYREPQEGEVTFHWKRKYRDLQSHPMGTALSFLGVQSKGLTTLRPLHKMPHVVWGNVSYDHQYAQGQLWNETADYQKLYPYVMGDSIGGPLTSSIYHFDGGYSLLPTKYAAIGVKISFDGNVSYRRKDPRPKNIATRLAGALSGSFHLHRDHLISLLLSGERYKQSNDISFYSQIGNSFIYHLTGIGTVHPRFSGVEKEVFYSGNGYKLGCSWVKMHSSAKRELSMSHALSLHFGQNRIEKIMANINNAPLFYTIASNGVLQAYTDIRWRKMALHPYLSLGFSCKTGMENILGDPAQGEYTVLNTISPFQQKTKGIDTGIQYEQQFTSNDRLLAAITYSYKNEKEQYILQENQGGRSLSTTKYSLQGGWIHTYKKVVCKGLFTMGYITPRPMQLAFPPRGVPAVLAQHEEMLYNYLCQKRYFTQAEITCRIPIGKKIALGIAANAHIAWYKKAYGQTYELKSSLYF